MRRLPAALAAGLVALCAVVLAAPASAKPLPPAKTLSVEYADPAPGERAAHRLLTRRRPLERAGRVIGRELALGRPLTVLVVGENAPVDGEAAPGPHYDPRSRTIRFSYGFVDDVRASLRRLVRRERVRMSPDVLTAASLEFILYHEAGHALIRRLDLPITGREEDAVDQLAALMSVSSGKGGRFVPLAAAMLFAALDDGTAPGAEEYADEHSLKQQRVYTFMCLVYGSDPTRLKVLVGEDGLPERRAVRCPAEWYQAYRSWTRLLRPYARTKQPVPPPLERLVGRA